MSGYQFHNVQKSDQFISADVFKNNNYMLKLGAEILHISFTEDIDDELFQEFRRFVLSYLETHVINDNHSTNIIKMSDYKKGLFHN